MYVFVSSQVMQLCGDTEGHMAKERLQLELDLESRVLSPLVNITEVKPPMHVI